MMTVVGVEASSRATRSGHRAGTVAGLLTQPMSPDFATSSPFALLGWQEPSAAVTRLTCSTALITSRRMTSNLAFKPKNAS
jgi:hypothetical protein